MVTYAPVLIEPPAVAPLPFGLLNAATIVPHGDARFGMGVQYQPDYCGEAYDTAGICQDFGELSISVDDAGEATITATGFPDGVFAILWGDEDVDDPAESVDTLDGTTHTYAAPDDYDVIVTGPRSYRAFVTVTVVDTDESGPFEATVGIAKIVTEGMDTVSAEAFAIMHMFRCAAPGSIDMGAERARRALQLGEGRAVERVVARLLARDENAVKLTDTAQHPVDALAMLEKHAGAEYPGVPIVHGTRDVGTILTALGAVDRYGDHLESKQGARFSSGGGYAPLREPNSDTDTPLETNAAGVEWLYVTGHVSVHRSEAIDVSPTISTSPANNLFVALSERLYAVTYECVVAAVPVNVAYAVPTT